MTDEVSTKTGPLIEAALNRERRIPDGSSTLPYANAVNSDDIQFLDGLLPDMQSKGNLKDGVNFCTEFTPTTKSGNAEYLDRSHIAFAYDDHRFRFDMAMGNAAPAEERISRLVKLVNTWTGITSDWSKELEAGIAEKFSEVESKVQGYNAKVRAAEKAKEDNITLNVKKAMEALKPTVGVIIPNEEDMEASFREIYTKHFDSEKFEKIQDIQKVYPRTMTIPVEISTDKGSLTIELTYKVSEHISTSLHNYELYNPGAYDAHIVVEGQLPYDEGLNFSLEAVHEAGFEGMRELYWRVAKEGDRSLEKEDSLKDKRLSPFTEYPRLTLSWGNGTINALDTFQKELPNEEKFDEPFYKSIRNQFHITFEGFTDL